MRSVRAAVLYTALIFGANPAAADIAAADAVRDGDMKKMNFALARALPDVGLVDMQDAPRSLGEFKGKWVLVNFWATWCAPCRTEMPSLGALQREMGGDRFEVVTVATGRNPPEAIVRFFEEISVPDLTVLRDPGMKLGRSMGVAGLPVTVVLNPDGQEVGRLIGDADWASGEAKQMILALMGR